MRKLSTLIIAALAALALPSAVAAAIPDQGSFDSGYVSFVDQEVCAPAPWGFDVNVTEREYGTFQVFFDGAGDVTRINVHLNYDATISANGKTIYERDTWTWFIAPHEGSRSVGLTVHIQGAGGIVQLDAGQIVFDADGNFEFIHGPHPQFMGEVFCPGLTP
jgi:opacity protein-like surface antigen